jgi:hypothetical protein
MQFDVHNFLVGLKYEASRTIDKHVIYLPPNFVMPRRRLQADMSEPEPVVEKLY